MKRGKCHRDTEAQRDRQHLAMVAASGIEMVEVPLTRHRAFDEHMVQLVVDVGLTPILLADSEGDFSVTERRKEFRKSFRIRGGMEVRVLLQGERAIDAMIARAFSEAANGGYFPTLCDKYGELLEVPFQIYEYYTQAFRKANGMERPSIRGGFVRACSCLGEVVHTVL